MIHRTYDLRADLKPRRVTNAMWDYSWIYGHQPGGAFEDWDLATDQLLERGFNTVRVDACPWWVGHLDDAEGNVDLPAQPDATWGVCANPASHRPLPELLDFLSICSRKGIHSILSTWNKAATGIPAGNASDSEKLELLWRGWERVLDAVETAGLGDSILYVDLDQEYPYFSPTQAGLRRLAAKPASTDAPEDAMEAAGRRTSSRARLWNDAQLDFVHDHFNQSIARFQARYPERRFTFSLTGFWEEARSLQLRCFDVLELHFWIHGARFDNRTGFGLMQKDRAVSSLADYQLRVDRTLRSVRPMLMAEMHNRLAFARDWAAEIAAPLVTTEAWGPWWHMDHSEARWDWLREWCEECMGAAADYGLWGITPWNYAHPYWDNWRDAAWYRKVNHRFLEEDNFDPAAGS
jgi:hypothetical protein